VLVITEWHSLMYKNYEQLKNKTYFIMYSVMTNTFKAFVVDEQDGKVVNQYKDISVDALPDVLQHQLNQYLESLDKKKQFLNFLL
jgi:hypothetical protein